MGRRGCSGIGRRYGGQEMDGDGEMVMAGFGGLQVHGGDGDGGV